MSQGWRRWVVYNKRQKGMIFFSKQNLIAPVLICDEWPSYKSSRYSPIWVFDVSISNIFFNHSKPSLLSVQLFSERAISYRSFPQSSFILICYFLSWVLSLKIIYRLKTVPSKEIHSMRVTYSRLLSCKLFGLFSLFKTIQRYWLITPIIAPFLSILYVSPGWILYLATVSEYNSKK
jgi:hypothetical protein